MVGWLLVGRPDRMGGQGVVESRAMAGMGAFGGLRPWQRLRAGTAMMEQGAKNQGAFVLKWKYQGK